MKLCRKRHVHEKPSHQTPSLQTLSASVVAVRVVGLQAMSHLDHRTKSQWRMRHDVRVAEAALVAVT